MDQILLGADSTSFSMHLDDVAYTTRRWLGLAMVMNACSSKDRMCYDFDARDDSRTSCKTGSRTGGRVPRALAILSEALVMSHGLSAGSRTPYNPAIYMLTWMARTERVLQ